LEYRGDQFFVHSVEVDAFLERLLRAGRLP
jgi:hypothetical protein